MARLLRTEFSDDDKTYTSFFETDDDDEREATFKYSQALVNDLANMHGISVEDELEKFVDSVTGHFEESEFLTIIREKVDAVVDKTGNGVKVEDDRRSDTIHTPAET